ILQTEIAWDECRFLVWISISVAKDTVLDCWFVGKKKGNNPELRMEQEFQVKKAQKQLNYNASKKNATHGMGCRSVHWKQNKARGFRRRADRASHHRRRNQVRNVIAHNILNGRESVPP